MKTLRYIAMLSVVFFVIAGCSEIKEDYSWSEYKFKDKYVEVGDLTGLQIQVKSGNASSEEFNLGHDARIGYYSSLQYLSDSIVKHLKIEFIKKSAVVNDSSSKTIMVTLNSTFFEEGSWRRAVNFNFTVEFGDRVKKQMSIRNASPDTIKRIYNGAIAKAVLEILNDSDVIEYLHK